MNFPIYRFLLIPATIVFCGLLFADEDTLTQPNKLKSKVSNSGEPSNYPMLVYPEDGPVGYLTTELQQRPNNPAIRRRYMDTPTPETIAKTTTIRSAVGRSGAGRAVQVSDTTLSTHSVTPSQTPERTVMPSKTKTVSKSPLPPNLPERLETSPETPRLRPMAEQFETENYAIDPYRPPVRTAAFQGVVPGETTLDRLNDLWGEPLQKTTIDNSVAHLYATEILSHIEVIFKDNIVKSIVVQLDEPFPEEQVREVLKTELLKSKSVLIPDETGKIIGEVFPEKGVLFLFAPSEDNGLLVKQIGIEPVSSEPFVLRAEATLNDQPSEAQRDLLDAIRINPDDAKAFWLLAQIEMMSGNIEAALIHAERSIKLDERRPAYHLTYVQSLVRMNRIEEAKLYLEETIGICDRYPHEKARALSMLGDLYRTSQTPDYEIAIECHSDAIRLAMTLIDHENQTIRQIAKDVLFEAHLGAARDVAWGRWDKKEESIAKWISRAREITKDTEIIAAKRFSNEYPFKIAVCILAAQVGLPEQEEMETYIDDVMNAGNDLIDSTRDPILQRKYQWETSLSLYDAVQIFQLRKNYSAALKYGELTADYMEAGIKDRKSDTDFYLLGRLYFRLGAIHAIGNQNHRAAIEWFDLAKPVFEKLLPKINPEALGRLGETLVSMGVSYWTTDQREEAIRLTERGLKQIERGVKNKTIDESALSIPYSNLANMYRETGKTDIAERYSKLAANISEQ
jgi:tetratricopeptide (TPR) repeat protein